MDTQSAIAVLTAMITPAVLISACGSMILSTSTRLGRVVDRVRTLSDRLETLNEKKRPAEDLTDRQEVSNTSRISFTSVAMTKLLGVRGLVTALL